VTGHGVGGHQSSRQQTDSWLTPPAILAALGPFDLDPCAAPDPAPWPTATAHYRLPTDGLTEQWAGRVWLNPPYSRDVGPWVAKLARHGHGTALVFARTETAWFWTTVWQRATALLFLTGRLHFHLPDGRRAPMNAGAPSVLAAYGAADAALLRACGLPGTYVAEWTAGNGRLALFDEAAS